MFRNNRQSTGYLGVRPDKFNFTELSINDSSNREFELWTILEYYSEINEVRNKFIKQLGITNNKKIDKISKNFQSFIRQAKNYYSSAKKLPNSSSALLYYYSFMNLAKAYLVLYYPDKILTKSGKVRHGLRDSKRCANFKDEHVFVDNGIFKILYEHETKETANKASFKIVKLLGYCIDISYQYLQGGFGGDKNAKGSMIIFIDQNRKKAWGTLAVHNFNAFSGFKKRIKTFEEKFERVEMDKSTAKQCFDLSGIEKKFFSFYEGKEYDLSSPGEIIPETEIIRDLSESTKGFLIPNHYDDKYTDFCLASPYTKNNQLLMNEFLAIFIIMFYLSSLVRYQPYYLDKILDKKESWLINSFVKSCPQTFLLYMVSKITKQNYVLTQR